jgi:hypothetical protein
MSTDRRTGSPVGSRTLRTFRRFTPSKNGTGGSSLGRPALGGGAPDYRRSSLFRVVRRLREAGSVVRECTLKAPDRADGIHVMRHQLRVARYPVTAHHVARHPGLLHGDRSHAKRTTPKLATQNVDPGGLNWSSPSPAASPADPHTVERRTTGNAPFTHP